jgi:hypothetical protein
MVQSTPAAARSNVVPLRPAASSGIDEVGQGFGGAATAYAPSLAASPPAPVLQPPAPVSSIAPAVDPFALPLAPPAPTPAQPATSPFRESMPSATPSMHPPPPSYVDGGGRRTGVPLWFWPILVLALGFGGGVAFLVFRPQPPPAPVVIQMPQAATAQPTEKVDTPAPSVSAEPAPTTSETKAKPAAAPVAKAAPKPTEERKGLDLGNLVPNGGGPNVSPNGPSGGAGAGLDQAGVERVVAAHRTGVKRTCWERGGADQKSSVNVTVTANVGPDGNVASTSSSGDDPVVAKCIESQVKTWQVPRPGSNTTINIPFKFVRQ